ncbi:MAG: hypothetical protein M3R12_06645 [Actinomycetota bacterium]|nr:hypothetical protein [Actinomycetota bacterium]
MDELDGEWEVRRVSGMLPPLYGVRKRINGGTGETMLGPLNSPFDVVGRELRYRGFVTRGLVDEVEPDGDGWRGIARYRGRPIGRFAMRRVVP